MGLREETLREPGTSQESGLGSAIFLLGGIMASMGALYWVVPSFPETLAAIIILLSITLIGVRVNLPQPLLDLLKHVANVIGLDITHDSDRSGEASTPKPRA